MMKNRYFPFVIGILCLCGLIFFVVSRFPDRVSVKIYKSTSLPDKGSARTNLSDVETLLESEESSSLNLSAPSSLNVKGMSQLVQKIVQANGNTLQLMDETEVEFIERFWQILESSEYQEFINTKMQEWALMYEQTGIFDFSFQDFFDFYESQGMPASNASADFFQLFRGYFPTGSPEDYEAEMAARFQDSFLAAPGTRTQARYHASRMLRAEPDYTAWTFGKFKGEIGAQIRWQEEQVIKALALEDAATRDAVHAQPSELPDSDVPKTLLNESNGTSPAPASGPSVGTNSTPTLFPVEQKTAIQEVLQHYDTDEGLLHLLETDEESARWLLEHFNSLDEIEAWRDKNATQAPSMKQQPASERIPFSTEPLNEPKENVSHEPQP